MHPIFQAIPAAVLPASTTFDVLARISGDDEGLIKAAHYSLIFGLLGAVGAAATGALDYYGIKNRPVRRALHFTIGRFDWANHIEYEFGDHESPSTLDGREASRRPE